MSMLCSTRRFDQKNSVALPHCLDFSEHSIAVEVSFGDLLDQIEVSFVPSHATINQGVDGLIWIILLLLYSLITLLPS